MYVRLVTGTAGRGGHRARVPILLACVAQVPIGFILMTANAAPSGSESTAKRPGGMSMGGTSVVAPAAVAFETVASVSSTAK